MSLTSSSRTSLIRACSPAVRKVLVVKFFLAFGSSLFHSMLASTLADRFGLGAHQNGWVFSYSGVIAVVAQLAFNLRPRSILRDETLLLWASLGMTVSFVVCMVWCDSCSSCVLSHVHVDPSCISIAIPTAIQLSSLSTQLWQFCIILVPLLSSASVLYSLSTSMLTKSVDPRQQGVIIGLDMAIGSCQRIVAPLLGTYVVSQWGYPWIGVACALTASVGVGLQCR